MGGGGVGAGSGPLMEPTDPFNQGRGYGMVWYGAYTPSQPFRLFFRNWPVSMPGNWLVFKRVIVLKYFSGGGGPSDSG